MSPFTLDARIIQKKDQLEELSVIGTTTPIVEEIRTGQQFLIKLQLSNNGQDHDSRLPPLRVSQRVAINTTGEPRTGSEPLTLDIAVHLVKSGQVRKSACAKCCHKYGPSSPILLLLDTFSPSATDPAAYAHVDTTAGSITMLAKILCSSTDHGERGNKDRYIFEFKLKRGGCMPSKQANSISQRVATPEDEGEIVAACFTPPLMATGHHKAKGVCPHQRPSRVTKSGPAQKTKVIKRHKSDLNIVTPLQGNIRLNGSMDNNAGFPSGKTFLLNRFSHVSTMGSCSTLSTDTDKCTNSAASQHPVHVPSMQDSSAQMQQRQQEFPRIMEVRPNQGPVRKTTDVVLRGVFFREGMIPYFGCFPAQDVVVEATSLIICKAPENPLPGTVSIAIYDSTRNRFAELGQFTYTDDTKTKLLILKLQLQLVHRALEYLHTQATGRRGNAADIIRNIPADASLTGARTWQEFHARSPCITEPTQAMIGYLFIRCSISNTPRLSTLLDSDVEEQEKHDLDNEASTGIPFSFDSVQVDILRARNPSMTSISAAAVLGHNTRVLNDGDKMTALAGAFEGAHSIQNMPSLDQQRLPPFHVVTCARHITINTDANPESGYHSGIYSEVHEYLNRLHLATLPSEGVQMTVLFKKRSPTNPSHLPIASTKRMDLFRTGDSFDIEIRLVTTPSLFEHGEQGMPMPREYIGIRFPQEMVKRARGRPASLLSAMTYTLKVFIELGKPEITKAEAACKDASGASEQYEDDMQSSNACCKACSEYLHEHEKLPLSRRSGLDPRTYPTLHVSVPGATFQGSSSDSDSNSFGVVELREGACEVNAGVNCSSIHRLIRRERARRMIELKTQATRQ
ncbi:hypothetical protein BGX28_007431 [Mortierella sp. GBA30]|nr:hypothetical protein BGX28_007431 [Mortierella sp. GBA30]